MRFRRLSTLVLILIFAVAMAAFLASCSGGNSSSSPTSTQPGRVNLSMSDPATCSGPQGPFSHVYVTVTDVQIHTNPSAGSNDSGWIDLTPGLKSSPMQIDLLGTANSQCFLASLGSGLALEAGTYQQMRVMLADNAGAKVANNQCGPSANNCVVMAADGSLRTLNLSSESQTGLKIPSGQLAGGQFTIAAGQTKDLNIDFDACASCVAQGNGQFRLKPVLHAGEVSLNSSSISGKLVDKATNLPLVGGKAIVALEQKDSANVDRIIMHTTPDASGNFAFCPVPAGTYDVVAVGVNGAGVAYAATITTGVQPGTALGNLPLIAQGAPNTAPGSITGQVTTTTGSAATAADVSVAALQTVSIGGANVQVIIPLAQASSATASLSTANGASCPGNTACASYTLQVPAANPTVGAFSSSGTTYTAGAAGSVNYSVNALAFVPSSGGTADCSPSSLTVSTTSTATPLTVTAGTSVTAATLAFTGCQ